MRTTTTADGTLCWHFTKPELVALLAHMSNDLTRTSQFGLILDPTTGKAMTTDGHRAAIVDPRERVDQDRAALGATFLVKRDVVEERLATHKGEPEFCFTPADASHNSFAPILQVIPKIDTLKDHRGVATGFNTAYLADLNLITKAIPPIVIKRPRGKVEKLYASGVFYPPTEGLSPLRVEFNQPGESHWTAVVMPVRV